MGLECSILQLWSFGIGYLDSIPWSCIQRCLFNSFLWCDCFWISIRDDCNFCYSIGSIHCSSITTCSGASYQPTLTLSRYFPSSQCLDQHTHLCACLVMEHQMWHWDTMGTWGIGQEWFWFISWMMNLNDAGSVSDGSPSLAPNRQ